MRKDPTYVPSTPGGDSAGIPQSSTTDERYARDLTSFLAGCSCHRQGIGSRLSSGSSRERANGERTAWTRWLGRQPGRQSRRIVRNMRLLTQSSRPERPNALPETLPRRSNEQPGSHASATWVQSIASCHTLRASSMSWIREPSSTPLVAVELSRTRSRRLAAQ